MISVSLRLRERFCVALNARLAQRSSPTTQSDATRRPVFYLLLNQFYPPDPAPTGVYLHDLARTLARRGHRVQVFCSRRSYDGTQSYPCRELRNEIEVVRLPAFGFGRKSSLGKLADYSTFYASLLVRLMMMRRSPDIILSLTTPPYLGLLGKIAAWRHHCRHAHWIMDLYPDVLLAHELSRNHFGRARSSSASEGRARLPGSPDAGSQERDASNMPGWPGRSSPTTPGRPSGPTLPGATGSIAKCPAGPGGPALPHPVGPAVRPYLARRADSLIQRILQRLTRFQLRGAQIVLTLGPVMAEKVSRYVQNHNPKEEVSKPSTASLHWLPLWADNDLAPSPANQPNPMRMQRGWQTDETVLLYSGNMGLGHRFDEFLEAACRLGDPGPRWVFSGGGKRRAEIVAFAQAHPEARIELLDYVSHSELRVHLCAADVHLASMDSAWNGLMAPSKLQASFAVGRPVIYVGGRTCETAAWIQESGGGWIVGEDDVEGLLAAVHAALDPGERIRRGQAAFRYAQECFRMEKNCEQIADLLESGAMSTR